MAHYLANGDATMVELQPSTVEDMRALETTYNDVSIAKQLPFHVVYFSSQVIMDFITLNYFFLSF